MTGEGGKAALPADTRLGRVRLRVRDATRSAAFYGDLLGLEEHGSESGGTAFGGPGGDPAVVLFEERTAAPRPPGSRGLFHVALLMPDRASLGAALARLLGAEYPVQGFADHHVSEAVYLADPDGNGIELYVDRPASAWKRTNSGIFMTTRSLDVESLLDARSDADPRWAPADTCVGHIHLQVDDLASAENFYGGTLGFDVVNRHFAGALFLSAGGYHHHIGLNTWGRPGVPPDGIAGLVDFEIRVPDRTSRGELASRAGIVAGSMDVPISFRDPDGNSVLVTA